MAKTSGNQVNIGMAIESSPGTPEDATIFPKWTDFSLQAISEKALFKSSRGIRNESSNSIIKRKYSAGSIGVVPNVEIAPYFFGLGLGSVASLPAPTVKETGTATSTTGDKLVDTAATFTTNKILVGDTVYNRTDNTTALVTAIDSETQLSLDTDIIVSDEVYEVRGNRESGSCTSTVADKLTDTAATFDTNGVAVGDVVRNTTDDTEALVTAIDSETVLSIDTDIMVSGETYTVNKPVWIHTITTQEDNASMKAATLLAEEGAIQTARYSNIVCNALNFEVSDDFAKMTMDIIGQFPDTGSVTESYTEETEFAYKDYTAKFGTTIALALAATATPLKAFTINNANNVRLDEAFLSGSNGITSGGLVAGKLLLTGSYTLHFEDLTELNKYKANTKNSMVVSFRGASIGSDDTEEIEIKLGKLIITSPPVEFSVDGLLIVTQEFEVEYDATDKDITVVITNEKNGTDYV